MGFGDLKTKSGQEALNKFLADHSYIEGYEPTQADAVVFSALTGAPPSSLPHALRWWNHISSYGNEKSKFTGQKKDVSSYGPATGDAGKADADDDFDLFGDEDDDEVDEAAEALRKQKASEYAAKKSKKPLLIAKSNIILEVKPWDDETDMKKVEQLVRTVSTDGLLWGASKLVPVGYGIHKLQITCVVEDDKVGTDFLEESITAFEDLVQSVDIVAFNKI